MDPRDAMGVPVVIEGVGRKKTDTEGQLRLLYSGSGSSTAP